MIRAIIFDCFGVLTTDLWRAFLDALPAGVDIDRARELNRALDAGIITRQEFIEEIEQLTGKRPPVVETLRHGEFVKNEQLIGYIRELKQSYAIGMISNISSNWIREHLLSADEQQLFDIMVLSHEVGMTKPDPTIYLHAAEMLGIAASECVFLDDSEGHCDGARAVGMHAITYKDFNQAKRELNELLSWAR